MQTWVGKDYPAKIAIRFASSYVTPGSGLLYQQVRHPRSRRTAPCSS